MIKKLTLLLSCFALWLSATAQSWYKDVLGPGFQMRYVEQPADYDGPARCTLVRHIGPKPTGKAVVYIHGFNDYFFQAEMARQFLDHGYDFYALDLRRYGRSIRPGDRKFDVRDMSDYFQDIDSALTAARHGGNYEIILMGHSTGGLLASYYMALNPAAPVDALVLNSPFLDWNLGWKEYLVPVVSVLGKLFPRIPISQGADDVYSQSMLASAHGEWTYNTSWKMPHSPDVTAGWIHAINSAQDYLRHHKYSIHVPVLLMFSAASSSPSHWTPEASRTDVVLDVKDICRDGLTLSRQVQPVAVKGGMHDLMLSYPALRAAIYTYLFNWLRGVK